MSGCLTQTAWNAMSGRPLTHGIDDIDLIYFDPDTSWSAENQVIQSVEASLGCAGAPLDQIPLQIRNQARVPLWYEQKFGFCFPPVREAQHSVLRYPSRSTALAVTLTHTGSLALYAPFGVRDALTLRVRPNPRLPLRQMYEQKVTRWRLLWPELRVEPWLNQGS
ncbi:MAG: nucleotidyltransferase family protein [Pseudomonadota bacterium]